MFIHYKTAGLIFSKEDRGDSDQLFNVYTEEFGKLDIIGKAIRKISSKLRAGADIFFLSDIEFIQGKNQKTLIDAIFINKFSNLKRDLAKLKVAHDISEVLGGLLKGQEPDEQIWRLLKETFEKLDNCLPAEVSAKAGKLEIIYHCFLWNFFSLLGYQLDLYSCGLCQKELKPEKNYFSRNSGIICQDCFAKIKKGKELALETIKILRMITKKDYQILEKIKTGDEKNNYLEELSNFSKTYYSFICENF